MRREQPWRAIGLIADTHGLVRTGVHEALAGVEVILHAGDVGGYDVLDELATIAPVLAVYGNTDPPGQPGLLEVIEREVEGLTIHVSHGHEVGSPTPERLIARYSADVIVFGHTHRPLVTTLRGQLVVNPGAAGPRRFDVQPSVAKLLVRDGQADVELIPIPGE